MFITEIIYAGLYIWIIIYPYARSRSDSPHTGILHFPFLLVTLLSWHRPLLAPYWHYTLMSSNLFKIGSSYCIGRSMGWWERACTKSAQQATSNWESCISSPAWPSLPASPVVGAALFLFSLSSWGWSPASPLLHVPPSQPPPVGWAAPLLLSLGSLC